MIITYIILQAFVIIKYSSDIFIKYMEILRLIFKIPEGKNYCVSSSNYYSKFMTLHT